MKRENFLLDTHALIFWVDGSLSTEFISFLNAQNQDGRLFVSPISFWETALLVQKGRTSVDNVNVWTDEVLSHSGITLLAPTVNEMINSVSLPWHHKDPFDRLLIAQAIAQNMVLVTRDEVIPEYPVSHLWQ